MAILFLSCKTYESNLVSIDEAIASDQVVRIEMDNTGPFRFDKLIKENDTLYGLVKRNNFYNHKLKNYMVDKKYQRKYRKFILEEESIEGVKLGESAGTAIVTSLGFILLFFTLIPV